MTVTTLGTVISPANSGTGDASLSELDYMLANFDELFCSWRGKRIALHGVREYAQAIVEVFDSSYRFVAVVTQAEDAGVHIAGKPTWTNDQLIAEKPDLVILTERVRHAEAVYQEIGKQCRAMGIPLFDMYGVDWLAMRDAIDAQMPLTLQEWLDVVEPYDIVSFEVPDCLMTGNAKPGGSTFACNPDMRCLIDSIVERGKRVLYIGRRPYSAQEQLASLVAEGLITAQNACEYFFMREGEDGAWRTIRAFYPNERILHVGYGIAKECVLPRYYGADTYRMIGGVILSGAKSDIDKTVADSLDPLVLRKQLETAIERASIVSFDVFDTLLVRTTLVPDDVFVLAEQKALERGLPAEGFAAARCVAQARANAYTAESIYETLQIALDIDDAQRNALQAIELEIEREVIKPRQSVCALYRRAVELGKRVFLVSDMYHSSETMASLLADAGITGYEQLLVSSSCGMLKRQGLFDKLAMHDASAERIVHIGNSLVDDVEHARAVGFETVLVPSPLALALAYGWNRKMVSDMTLEDRCKLGITIAATFADPFQQRAIPVLTNNNHRIGNPHVAALCSRTQDVIFAEKAAVRVARYDERIPESLRKALLAWYPFPTGARALFVGADQKVFGMQLAKHFDEVDYECRPNVLYDCIVALDLVDTTERLHAILSLLRNALSSAGVLIVGFRNRFGIKYLCGGTDDIIKEPFDTLDGSGHSGTHGKTEMQHAAMAAGLVVSRTYHVMPDAGYTQAIYTDDYLPTSGIHDRVMPFDAYESPLVAAERDLYSAIAEEGMLGDVANYYLMECRLPDANTPVKQIAHVALSLDRESAHSFITTIFTDGTVRKAPANLQAYANLEALFNNCRALRERDIKTVDMQLTKEGIWMPFVHAQPLLTYLDSLLPNDPAAFVTVFEQLYADVLRSSNQTSLSAEEAQKTWRASCEDLGPILQTGFIDMVPYNAFWENGKLSFFDQEFTIERCPAKYILFRALYYTWIHLPHAERTIALDDLKRHFELVRLWGGFLDYENGFVAVNRNHVLYRQIYEWARIDYHAVTARRHALASSHDSTSGKPYQTGLLMGVFDLFHVGHLRLIKRARQRCNFLRVAVLSDKLVFKLKGITPTIPLEQRLEILAAIDGVDEVVAIEDSPSRLVEWKRRHFDCFFSGDDYAGNASWDQERAELEKLGATIELFPYTTEQSSTSIRKALEHEEGGAR